MTELKELGILSEIDLPPAGLASDVLPPMAKGPDALYEFADAVAAQAEAPVRRPQRIETWVALELAGETYALPVSSVLEILRVPGITRVPHSPRVIRGVTNMRGKVLPVVDLRIRLGMPAVEVGPQSRILVASSRGRLLGLLVDAVQQVERIDREAVQPPPADVMTAQSDYIVGVCQLGERLVILLDVELVLTQQGEMS